MKKILTILAFTIALVSCEPESVTPEPEGQEEETPETYCLFEYQACTQPTVCGDDDPWVFQKCITEDEKYQYLTEPNKYKVATCNSCK